MNAEGAAAVTTSRIPDNAATRIARTISWIGHPLVFVSVSVALVVFWRLANRVGLLVLLALIVAVVLPTALLLIRGVRSGRWSDADVSVQTERRSFYPRAILISFGGVIALVSLKAPAFIVQGAGVTLVLLLAAAAINRYLKVSLHTIFAFYCAVVLLRIGMITGIIALGLAALVVWSRLHLKRHTPIEVLLGLLLGTCGGIITAWWP